MVAAQDHKRVFDGDQGPNTGGMGAYAPVPALSESDIELITARILQPAVDALRREGTPYRGCLYAGLMLTREGPRVVEFNARFGDPETQAVLPLLTSDLVPVLDACAGGGDLSRIPVVWSKDAAVCVVLAAGGYPGSYRKGDRIDGLEAAEKEGALIFHAGTAKSGDKIVTAGGRVLGVAARAATLEKALEKAYAAAGRIRFPNVHYRRDIAWRAFLAGRQDSGQDRKGLNRRGVDRD
jgi:phosphoribosylamine--glycine ligase